MTTVPQLLDRAATNFPEHPAILSPAENRTLSYAGLQAAALSAAGVLGRLGVHPGDRVALLVGNTIDFPIAFLGILRLGAVAVPLNPRLTQAEIAALLDHAEVKAVVAQKPFRDLVPAERQAVLLDPQELIGQPAEPLPYPKAEDDAEVLYTSGTTGSPKGALLTNAAACETAAMAAYEFGMRPLERVLIAMPLTHSAPLNLFLVGAIATGSCIVLDSFNPREPAALLQTIQAHKAKYLFAAPVAYLLALRAGPERYDLSSMRRFIYGGAPMAKEQVEAVRKAFGGEWMGVYGLTESGPNGIALQDRDHPDHAGSLGWHPTINAEVRLVDEYGADVQRNAPGELIMRTPSAMRGYLKNAEATAQVLQDGWIHTGDMAFRDVEGYYWMLDRKKDLILSGGFNVFPREVEEAILRHPSVADAAVVGTPHPDWGETVTAVVTLRPGEALTLDELREFVRPMLSSQKHPRRLEIVDALPRNPTGKLLKHVIRQRLT
ncbi:MAG: AMP-binding protein [Thermaerobacter sp.]|nr:AMP-binding protein [Thermaerobacter sp.]